MRKDSKFKSILAGVLVCSIVSVNSSFIAKADISDIETTYNKVEEIKDWGAATTKVIVDLQQIVQQGSVDASTFSVYVTRSDRRTKDNPLSEGYRNVINAYISDANGNVVEKGKYATIEMEVGPNVDLGSPLNYYDGSNVWIDCEYVITQENDIFSDGKTISGLVADTLNNRIVPLVDEFSEGSITYNDNNYGNINLTYADYTPAEDGKKNPLIIWLHGGGEGGTDTTIPISANKACNFASDEIQSYFEGAYVLAPQTPTKWMDDGRKDTTLDLKNMPRTSKYTKALKYLIDTYVDENNDIDADRIYIGGCSNGGFMTINMLINYPNYFAAAFPVCEGFDDKYIAKGDIELIKNIPMWFVCSSMDTTLPPYQFTLPTYSRLKMADAKDVQLSYFYNVEDNTGLYKDDAENPYEYNGHWSWIYVYNNDVSRKINEQEVSFMEWLASQSK